MHACVVSFIVASFFFFRTVEGVSVGCSARGPFVDWLDGLSVGRSVGR